jgi:hypothetical protein
MEVVGIAVTEGNEEHHGVPDSYHPSVQFSARLEYTAVGELTPCRWFVAKVLDPVGVEEALGLCCRSWSSRQLLVEGDNPVHPCCISRSSDGLKSPLSAPCSS